MMPSSLLFKDWTPEESWLAGLIWADGCLFSDRGSQRVQISTTDEQIASHVSDIAGINISAADRPGNRKRYYRMSFATFQPVSRLVSLGLEERKSRVCDWPSVPGHVGAFVRGYFDGDGTIYRSNGQLRVAIVGAERFLLGMEEVIREACDTKPRNLIRTVSEMFLLRFDSRSDIARLSDFMYEEERPCLERKRVQFIHN